MYSFDVLVQNYFSSGRSPFFTEVMYILTTLFDVSIHFILIVLCFAVLICLVKNIKYAILFAITLFSGTVVVYLLKNIFDIARPMDGFVSAYGSSFPSHHATSATIFFVILIYIFDYHFRTFGRIAFNTLCIAGIMLIAFSRVYLGVHWLSDVVFGIILGVFISFVAIRIFKSVINRENSRLNLG